jgi:hypothetical protein
VDDVGIFYGSLVYFTGFWHILWPFGLFYDLLVYSIGIIWYILSSFGMFLTRFGTLHQGKSGNPDGKTVKRLPVTSLLV